MGDDLFAVSSRYIDGGVADGPVNRVSNQLSELAEDLAVVESFSHVVAFRTDDGLVLFDTATPQLGPGALAALRTWTDERVNTIVYTHGHIDHVGGAGAFVAEAADQGQPRPAVVAHAAVPARFGRYDLTNGYNTIINARQFGGGRPAGAPGAMGGPSRSESRLGLGTWPRDWVRPSVTFEDRMQIVVGGLRFELRHHLGETDDHAWAWFPDRKTIASGDFLTWIFPNAGNPQKVQRYPLEWSRALREMASLEPEVLLPAHGLPITGTSRIQMVLGDAASALESLVSQTLALMNQGARLDDIVAAVRLPDEVVTKPWLRPTYDEPEFVVRNIWRLYGGWYDGNPSRLKPARDESLAAEVAALVGGVDRLVVRAEELAATDEDESLRLACHLIEYAAQAEPENVGVHRARADVYLRRRKSELSLMSKGIYGWAASESAAKVGEPTG